MRAGIALGSNIEPRMDHLQKAKDYLLQYHIGDIPALCSKIYETSPVACLKGTPFFLNAAIEISTHLAPDILFSKLRQIEHTLGRSKHHGINTPRTIDLDFLYYDELILSQEALTLPHPRATQREFVLKPLEDICPNRVFPGTSLTVREWLVKTPSFEKINLFGYFK